MEQRNVTFKWIKLYMAKVKERAEARQKSIDRLKKRYQEEDARKRTRQVQLCSKVPPSLKKRSYWGCDTTSNIYNPKSSIMKKSKLEFINSVLSKPKSVTASGSASSSSSWNKMIEPFRRRF